MALKNAFENLATDRKLDNPMPVEMAGFFKRPQPMCQPKPSR